VIEFFLDIVTPRTTHQQKKVVVAGGRPRFYEPQRLKEARQLFILALNPHRPREPFAGAVKLYSRWQFPRGKHQDGAYKVTRPDTDNLQKLLKDCMTAAGFWRDDAQVAWEQVEKIWSGRPGILVRIEELT